MTRSVRILTVVLACVLGVSVPFEACAQSEVSDRFDLLLVGSDLSAGAHQIALRTNPTEGDSWTTIGPDSGSQQCEDRGDIHVVAGLSTSQYVGQDIREHYVALKITTADEEEGKLRAAYALPSVPSLDAMACDRLSRLATASPHVLRRHGLAVYERPRPARLSADTAFIDHIEAPIRHRKPGVMEVEWLELLFRPEE